MSPADARPAGVLLAAGGGRRFGRAKALVRFHGEPLVCRGVRLLRDGGCGPVVVVVGADGDRVAEEVHDARVTLARNARWRTGMGSSLRAGLAAASAAGAPAAVIALVDQPLVAPEAVQRLIAAWRAGATVSAATYSGVARNPVLFDRSTWAAVEASVGGDEGARGLLRDRPEWVQPVPCDAVGSPLDIDTEDDLRALSIRPDPNPVAGDRSAPKEQQWN